MSNAILLAAVPHTPNYYAQKSYGVHRVATEFRKQGVSTQVVHYFNRFTDQELETLLKKFVDSTTNIIGFSTMFWEHYEQKEKELVLNKAEFVAKYIRTNYPNIKIIAGGPSCRIFLKDRFTNKIDAIFEGFSENDFIDYVTGKNKLPNKVYKGISMYNNIHGTFNFSESQTLYEKHDYFDSCDVPILEVGRGCIFKCKFCGFALNGKKKFDYIKDESILRDELIKNYENFGIQNYILSDDTFNDSTFKIEHLHSVFTSLPFKLRFSCYLRLDLLKAHPEQIPLLKEMGLVGTFFGIESFHYESAKLIGKGIRPEVAKEMLQDLKQNVWGHKIKIGIGLITGLPYETYESYDKTIEWILDENNLIDQVVPFPLTVNNPEKMRPSPWDSEFQKNAKDYGFSWPDGHEYNWHNSIGPVSTRKEAEEIYNRYCEAVSKSNRWKQGGFNLLKSLPLITSQKNPPLLDDLLEMDRYTYTNYVKNIEKNPSIETDYVDTYKKRILQ